MKKEIIIITGGTGFIGSHLVRRMKQDCYPLLIFLHRRGVCSLDNEIEIYQIPENLAELQAVFETYKVLGIIHLATNFQPSHTCDQIPGMISSNIEFGTILLDCAYRAGVSFFINIGTYWQHYNGEKYNPVNLYAATKQAFEDIAAYYRMISGMKIITLCLNDTYGSNDTRKKIFPLWKHLLDHPENAMMMSKGEQIIDILHVDDVVDGILLLLDLIQKNSPLLEGETTFYLTAKEKFTLRKTAEIFEEVSGRKLNIQWGARPYRDREVMMPQCSGRILPGWECKISLTDGIRRFLNGDRK